MLLLCLGHPDDSPNEFVGMGCVSRRIGGGTRDQREPGFPRGNSLESPQHLLTSALPMIAGLTTEARICGPRVWIVRALKMQTSIMGYQNRC